MTRRRRRPITSSTSSRRVAGKRSICASSGSIASSSCFLVWRDVKVRYKHAALGIAWAVLQPLMTMVIFTVVFGRLAGLPSEGVPYPLFTFAALLPGSCSRAPSPRPSNSLVGSCAAAHQGVLSAADRADCQRRRHAGRFCVGLGMLLVPDGLVRASAAARRSSLLPLFVLLALVTALGIGCGRRR